MLRFFLALIALLFSFLFINLNQINTASAVAIGANDLVTPAAHQACTPSGKVYVTFRWTPQANGAFFQTDQQWLDISTNAANPFGPGNFTGQMVTGLHFYVTSTTPGFLGPLNASTTYYWKINTHNALQQGLAGWYPSATASVTTGPCAPTGGGGSAECTDFNNCTDIPNTKPPGFGDTTIIVDLVAQFIPIALGMGGFLSVIIIVISGLQFITSNGNPEGAAGARGRLIFALVGFVLLIIAYALTKVIDTIFLKSGAL